MICKKCGMEYFGEDCPNCSSHIPVTPNLTPSPDRPGTEAPSPQSPDVGEKPAPQGGVHSNTVRNPFDQGPATPPSPSPYGNQTQPYQNQTGGWNQPPRPTPPPYQGTPAPQNPEPLRCPICGSLANGNYCSRCGYQIIGHQAPTPPPPPPVQNAYYQPYARQQTSSFTENYQKGRAENNNYKKKSSPWVVLLIVFAVVFQLLIPLVSTIAMSANGQDILNDLLDEYGYGEQFRNYDGSYDQYNNWDNNNDNGLVIDADFKETLSDSAVDEGEPILPNGVSVTEYRMLAVGMSYAEISAIIGGDAAGTDSSVETEGELVALWPGEYNVSAAVRITFVDNIATKIEQKGLD